MDIDFAISIGDFALTVLALSLFLGAVVFYALTRWADHSGARLARRARVLARLTEWGQQ